MGFLTNADAVTERAAPPGASQEEPEGTVACLLIECYQCKQKKGNSQGGIAV